VEVKEHYPAKGPSGFTAFENLDSDNVAAVTDSLCYYEFKLHKP